MTNRSRKIPTYLNLSRLISQNTNKTSPNSESSANTNRLKPVRTIRVHHGREFEHMLGVLDFGGEWSRGEFFFDFEINFPTILHSVSSCVIICTLMQSFVVID